MRRIGSAPETDGDAERPWRLLSGGHGHLSALASCFFVFLAWVPPCAASGEAARLEIVLAPSSESTSKLEESIADLLTRASIPFSIRYAAHVDPHEVIVPRAPSDPDVLGHAWIDWTSAERATLYLVDAPWERILIRHVPAASQRDEVARETIAHVLVSAAEAMRGGARIGLTRERAADELRIAPTLPVAPAFPAGCFTRDATAHASRAAPRSDGSGVRLELGVLYALERYASRDVWAHGPAISGLVETKGHAVRFGVWALAQVRFPMVVDASPLGVRLDTAAFRWLGTLDVPVTIDIVWRTGAGVGLDVIGVDSGARVRWACQRPESQQRCRLRRLRRERGPGLARRRLSGVPRSVVRRRSQRDALHSAREGQSPSVVLAPWAVRPGLVFGIAR